MLFSLPGQSLIHIEGHLFIGLKIIWDRLQRGAQLFCFPKKHAVSYARLPVEERIYVLILLVTKLRQT